MKTSKTDKPDKPAGLPVVEAPAIVVEPAKKAPKPAEVGDEAIAPTLTTDEQLMTESQRWTNKVWESVQAGIAVGVVLIALIVNAATATSVLFGNPNADQRAAASSANQNINILASLIIGFYFSRVNHQKTGGVQKGDVGR